MKYLRLTRITPANFHFQTERGQERKTKRGSIAMPRFSQNLSLPKASLSLMLLLLVSVATPGAFAQENRSADAITPLVYSVENTGATSSAPVYPSFGQLPIIRPLPDPIRRWNSGYFVRKLGAAA